MHLYRKLYPYLISVLLCTAWFMAACDANIPTIQNPVRVEEQPVPIEQAELTAEVLKDTEKKGAETTQIEIVISHSQRQSSPEHAAAQAMQQALQEQLGDRVDVILYADCQLGTAREQLEAVQLGRLHIAIQSAAELSAFVDDVKVLTMPYLFSDNRDEVIDGLQSAWGQELLERVNQDRHGFEGLGLWFGGYKLLAYDGAAQKEIHSPADFCDLKIAVADAPILKAQYHQWHAEAVVVEENLLFRALEQNWVDGCEMTVQRMADNRSYELLHNVVQAYHSAEIYAVLTNQAWFTALPADVQIAIREAEVCGRQVMQEELDERESFYLRIICQAEGMNYYVLNPSEIEIFRASVQPIYTEQLAGNQWQKTFVERLQILYNCNEQ